MHDAKKGETWTKKGRSLLLNRVVPCITLLSHVWLFLKTEYMCACKGGSPDIFRFITRKCNSTYLLFNLHNLLCSHRVVSDGKVWQRWSLSLFFELSSFPSVSFRRREDATKCVACLRLSWLVREQDRKSVDMDMATHHCWIMYKLYQERSVVRTARSPVRTDRQTDGVTFRERVSFLDPCTTRQTSTCTVVL